METTKLRSAYDQLIADARKGGFGAPAEGQWTAEQIVAHVATNDEMLSAATERVIAGDLSPYYNHDAIDTARLDELVGSHGSLDSLIDLLERTSARVCDLAARLSEQEPALVHTTLVDGGETRLDQPLPWAQLLKVQAKFHLPAHLGQLQGLRG